MENETSFENKDYFHSTKLNLNKCANCNEPFVKSKENSKFSQITTRNDSDSRISKISIVEAISSLFQSVLVHNNIELSPNENILMCSSCTESLSSLYVSHRKFFGNSHVDSFIEEILNNSGNVSDTVEIKDEPLSSPISSEQEEETQELDYDSVDNIKLEIEAGENPEFTIDDRTEDEKEGIKTRRKVNISLSELCGSSEDEDNDDDSDFVLSDESDDGMTVTFEVPNVQREKNETHQENLMEANGTNKEGAQKKKPQRKLNHTKEKKCPVCLKIFRTIEMARHHKASVHDGIRYTCTYSGCTKTFSTKQSRDAHERKVHSSSYLQVKFQCKICEKLFPSKAHRKKHIRYSHYLTEDDKIECSVCQKIFPHEKALKAHYTGMHHQDNLDNTGTKFVCDFEGCSKSFKTRRSLVNHKSRHRSEKRFMCEECGCSCKTSEHLRKHLREVHTNEYKYRCPVCNKGFHRKENIVAHANAKRKCKPGKPFRSRIKDRIENESKSVTDSQANV